jgi:hypothetical protein
MEQLSLEKQFLFRQMTDDISKMDRDQLIEFATNTIKLYLAQQDLISNYFKEIPSKGLEDLV